MKLLSVFIILLVMSSVWAHTDHFLDAAVTLGYQALRDESNSPLRFEGSHVSFKLSYCGFSQNYEWEVNNSIGAGFLNNETDDTSSFQYNFSIRSFMYMLRKFDLKNSLQIKNSLGAVLIMNTDLRLYSQLSNSAISYDVLNGLGPSWKIRRSFSYWGIDLEPEWLINLPLVFSWQRPDFVGLEDNTDGGMDILNEEYNTSFFGDIKYIQSRLRTTGWLTNGNGFYIDLDWQGYSIDDGYYKVQNSITAFSIGFLYSFTNRED